jgi:hypothetical protein
MARFKAETFSLNSVLLLLFSASALHLLTFTFTWAESTGEREMGSTLN